jgi:hypothetical protein
MELETPEEYLDSVDTIGGYLSVEPIIYDDRLYALITLDGHKNEKWFDFQHLIESYYAQSDDPDRETDLMCTILENLIKTLKKGGRK